MTSADSKEVFVPVQPNQGLAPASASPSAWPARWRPRQDRTTLRRL